MLVSSAKCRVVQNFMVEWRSLIYIKNNKGPKTEPCGTPYCILVTSE